MKKLIFIAALFISAASFGQGNWTISGAKNRWANGMGFGNKDTSTYTNASDTNLLVLQHPGVLVYRHLLTDHWEILSYNSTVSNYKLISDSLFNAGYTRRDRTKQGLDSLGGLKLNISDTPHVIINQNGSNLSPQPAKAWLTDSLIVSGGTGYIFGSKISANQFGEASAGIAAKGQWRFSNNEGIYGTNAAGSVFSRMLYQDNTDTIRIGNTTTPTVLNANQVNIGNTNRQIFQNKSGTIALLGDTAAYQFATKTDLSGYVPSSGSYYIGTTLNALNRASGSQTLTGVSIDGTAGNITATSNSTLTTLSALSLPYSQLTGTPSLSGYVPYTGATSAVNLGSNSLTAGAISGTTGTFSGDITLSSASRSIVFNTTNTLLWESGGSLRMRTGGVDALIINSSQAATFASSVTVGSDLYLPNGSSIYIGNTTYRLSTWNTSGDLYLGDVDNGYNNVIIRSGGVDALIINSSQAATFASSVTVGSDLYLPNASSIYIGNTTYRLSTWNTSGDLYLGDVDNGYNNVIIRSGGVGRLTFTNAGAATFASSVTASSLIKSGGTSSQLLAADGSVVTAGTNVTISGGTISASGGLNGNTGIISAQTTDQTITTYTPGSNGVYLVGGTFDVTAISGSNMEMYVEWTDQNSVSRSFALRSGVSAIQNNVFAPFSVTAKSGTAINIKVHFLSGSSATYDASAYIKSMN